MGESPFDRLGRELEAAAARQLAATMQTQAQVEPENSVRWRRPRRSLGLFAALLAVPVLAATGWAASTLLSTGSPVAYRNGPPVSGVGFGTPIASTVKLLTTSVPDPDGGLPWGLRTFRTTRGLACVQVGRVYEGKLGVLGRDGSFGDDGRFHELRPGIVPNESQCSPPDGAGDAYLAIHFNGYVASGEPCTLLACVGVVSGGLPPGSPPAPPLSKRRAVDFGLLGPRATRITYRSGSGTKTMRPLGAEGGYLIVRRPLTAAPEDLPARFKHVKGMRVNVANDYIPAMTPASRVIARVDYGSAAHCDVRPRAPYQGGAGVAPGGCPDPPGFVPIPPPKPAAVRAKVTASAVGSKEIRVRFRARVAVRDRLSAYNVVVYPRHHARPCPRGVPGLPEPLVPGACGLSTGDATDRNIPAGRVVVKDVGLFRRPPGRYLIVVGLRTQPAHPAPGGNLEYPVTPETLVGTTTLVVR